MSEPIPLPPRSLVVESKGRQRLKTVEQWGIPIETDVHIAGKQLMLCVDKYREPLPIDPNPRWMPAVALSQSP